MTKTIGYFLVVAVVIAPNLCAQTATLRGQVIDESGAIIPGAAVTLSSSAGQAGKTKSDEKGTYAFAGVKPGDYSVQATAPQLKQLQPASITLQPGTQTLNLTLQIAPISEKVTVARIPLLR